MRNNQLLGKRVPSDGASETISKENSGDHFVEMHREMCYNKSDVYTETEEKL